MVIDYGIEIACNFVFYKKLNTIKNMSKMENFSRNIVPVKNIDNVIILVDLNHIPT